jgi:hypothetical protein
METSVDNVFVKKLEASKQELQACQEKHQVKSCSDCEQFIGCELRKEYVKHVYESMSQGQTGGFEF